MTDRPAPPIDPAQSPPTEGDPADTPALPLVPGDTPCAICSYNLRGQPLDGNCPECGRPVRRTIEGDLRRVHPAWLRYQSTTMLWLGALCLFNAPPSPDVRYGMWVGLVFRLLTTAAMVYACWRLARPEGPDPPSDATAARQRGLRAAAVALGLITAFSLTRYWLREYLPAAFYSDRVVRIIPWAQLAVMVAVNWIAAYSVYDLARRARRAPGSLVGHARLVLCAMPLSLVVVLAFALGLGLADADTPDVRYVVFEVNRWVLAVVFVAAAALFGRMHEVLARAADDGES